MSACETFFIVLLLDTVKESYSCIAARNQLNCRGFKPHSHMTHHEGVVADNLDLHGGTFIQTVRLTGL